MFNSKPLLYLQLLDKSLRYLAVHPKNKKVTDHGEIVFETNILEDNKIINQSLLETRLDILVKEKKWKGAKAHILLMNNFVVIREESVPIQLERNEIREYLSLHMNESIRMPFENPVFDYQVFENDAENQKLVLIAYPGDLIKEYQQLLNNVSLVPEVADIISLSLYRLAENQELVSVGEDVHSLILQWNTYSMNMGVFHLERPTFTRNSFAEHLVPAWEETKEGEWVWQQTKAELELTLNEQLNGLERFLDFYRYSVLNGENQISEIILNGNYPDLNQIRELLIERFGLTVKTFDVPNDLGPNFAALYGLTLKEVAIKEKNKKKTKKVSGVLGGSNK